MKAISLLPPELKQKRQHKKKRAKIIFIALISFLFYIGIYGTIFITEIKLRAEIVDLRNRRTTLEFNIPEFQDYELKQNKLLQIKGTYNKAITDAPLWDQLLIDIGTAIPDRVWISDLKTEYQSQSAKDTSNVWKLTVRGYSYDHIYVAKWLEEIQSLQYLEEVRCRFSVKSSTEDDDLVQYEIEALIRGGN